MSEYGVEAFTNVRCWKEVQSSHFSVILRDQLFIVIRNGVDDKHWTLQWDAACQAEASDSK
jgi:hypothetical protein